MHVLYTLVNLNAANLEATLEAKMNYGVSLLSRTAFFNDVTITSSLRSVVQVLMGHFRIFQSHGLSR